MTQVASFTIEYTRYLAPDGKLTQELPEFAKDPKVLVHLYKLMASLRVFDTKAIALQRTGKMGTYASTLGQEAVSTAMGYTMKKDDVLCPAYREYGAQLQRGVEFSEILTYWGGDERGSNFANNREDFPISVPIGTQPLHAAGVATAFKLRKQPRVAVTSMGEGATSQGDFYEAVNVAGAWKLPMVFMINNNQWAISVPRSAQTGAQTIAQKAIAGGFTGVQVDGNDIIAVCDAMFKALEKARTGGGPTLIEAVTYRLCDHTTADDASRYRDKAELDKAWQEEPLLRLRKYLMDHQLWSESQEEVFLAECSAKIEKIVADYLSKPKPLTQDMFDYMYETIPHDLYEQRAIAVADAPAAGDHGHD